MSRQVAFSQVQQGSVMFSLSVKQRLYALMGGSALLLLVFGIAAILGMGSSVDALNRMYLERVVPLQSLKTVADDYAVLVVDTSHKVRNENISWDEGLANLDMAEARIKRLWEDYLQHDLDEREAALVTAIRPLIRRADGEIAALRKIFTNRDPEALTAFTVEALYPAIDPVSEGFSNLVAVQLEISEEIFSDAALAYSRTRNLFLVMLALAIAGLLITASRLVAGISRPLNEAVQHCDRLAGGDLSSRVDRVSHDEFGALITALNEMTDRLKAIVGEVNTAAVTINGSSREIAEGNLHLSQRTEQQAANLEETASNMEEMTVTVRQTAENAKYANQLASGARDEAQQGATIVADAKHAMNEINQSSQKIADITSVVDEIAFQTNLLALNAAVEAARAGDAGRGFAVVAAEVRVLAQRSAEAAKQIKALIEDSVSKVTEGSRLVGDSEQTLAGIVDSITQVSTIVSEISSSSEEQSDGISQVNQAVTQMDQSTQQNAALVEEAAAGAKSLEEQAVALEHLMAFFQLDAGASSGPATAGRMALAAPPTASVAPAVRRLEPANTFPAASRSATATKGANESRGDPAAQWEEF